MNTDTVSDTFVYPCRTCGSTVHVVAGETQSHDCTPPATTGELAAHAWWAGYDHAKSAAAPTEGENQ